MTKRTIIQSIMCIMVVAFMSTLQAGSHEEILSSVTSIENKSGAHKANFLDSVARANFQHILAKTSRRIRSLENRIEHCTKKLTLCHDEQKTRHLLDKIRESEEKLKSHKELYESLSQMDASMAKK